MSRTQKIRELLTAPKKDLPRVALSFMDIDTLHYLAEMDDSEIKIEELPEPYRTDVLTSYQKAKDEIPTK